MELTNLSKSTLLSKAGGKAVNLCKLLNSGLPVPSGYVLNGKTINQEEIEIILKALKFPLIVRSSATIEDGIITSFAGQFETIFPVISESQLKSAVNKVLNFNRSKLGTYLSHYNINPNDFQISAIVQEYVKPEFAGVIFTQDIQDKNKLIIEYDRLSAGVVSGKSKSKIVKINRETKKSDAKSTLSDKITRELTDISLKIEKIFGMAQDIEWVYDGKKIWIVQARPIINYDITPKQVIIDELNKFKKQFGSKVPHFVAHQFAEGLEHATPATTSLLQHMFSKQGSWGQFLKNNHIPLSDFLAKNYAVNIFGRLYLNKDLEQKILYDKLPFKPIYDKQKSLTSSPIYQGKLYYPGYFKLLLMIPRLLKLYYGDIRFKISAFKNYKKITKIIDQEQAKLSNNLPPNITSLKKIIDVLVNEMTPFLFQIAAYQQFAFGYLEKKVKKNLTESEWQHFIKTDLENKLLYSFTKYKNDKPKLLKAIGHRGFNELELSQPRFCESPQTIETILRNLKYQRSKQTLSASEFQNTIIEKFSSVWDQQFIATFINLYYTFSLAREQMHDIWIKQISELRYILLKLDQQAQLYNSIWYTSLEEIIAHYPNLDKTQLLTKRHESQILNKIPLPAELKINNWTQLSKTTTSQTKKKTLTGLGLTVGLAEGKLGTIQDLEKSNEIKILLVKNLDPSITIYYDNIYGIITEIGGQLAHAAIIAREYGLPIIMLENASQYLTLGNQVAINGETGTIKLIK